ncbi:hypothetical protein BV25DRAFT_1798238 [Artomyces pyxidatus]|uniref:Uncharacterized protein n=1 Tax=Artomyces pyxidatus TaxID=48021 RepID=A0ACB8TAE4_9AGAM|nr:hypothetical protein BV25DRAFT_1798238 [Artomyces pyxidatus]
MLLQWCTVKPSGPSKLAAMRFSAPVRVRSVRVFPKDARPFSEDTTIVSETEPDSFFLEVFFNAQAVSSHDSKQKQKATNALVPTVIAYAGGSVDFTVNMDEEYATRLMIVKGDFTKVSMSIYGDVVSEMSPPPSTYSPRPPKNLDPIPLSPVLDPSTSRDPVALARELLVLIPDAPPLPLVIRLMFCLKPSNDDWDLPEFPYIHPDYTEETMDFDLETAFRLTSRPVADDVSFEVLQQFADRVSDAVGPKSANQAYLIAAILSHTASQRPDLVRLVLDRLDIRAIFDASTMDEDTLDHLLAAAANPDIARHLTETALGNELSAMQRSPLFDVYTKRAARRLNERLQAWVCLSDAFQRTDADFPAACDFLRELGTDEPSFGVALHAFIANDAIVARLSEQPVPDAPSFGQHDGAVATHSEFITYMRAWIGISGVLAVYAWADSEPNIRCRERAFGILRVWQGTKGYREILNHLLLMRQMIFRLECMMDDDTPTRSGIHAEHILHSLAQQPTAFLSEHLIKSLLSLQPGLSAIDEDERQDLRDLALLADDGLSAAVDELTRPLDHPVDAHTVRTLRVALAMISHELESGDDGEWRTLKALWDQPSHGLTLHLLEILCVLTKEVESHFALAVPPRTPREHVIGLFHATAELMFVLAKLVPVYPLPGRQTRALVGALANLFAYADTADTLYTQGSDVAFAARRTHRASIELLRTLALPREDGQSSAEVVLRALLRHGTSAGERDPVVHLLQVFSVIDHFLPTDPTADSVWIRQLIPRVLTDLTTFYKLLDPENRARFSKKFGALDGGLVGVGEWLVLEELKQLRKTTQKLGDTVSQEDTVLFWQYQAAGSLSVLHKVTSEDSPFAQRLVEYVGANSEAATAFASSLNSLLSLRLFSPLQMSIAEIFVSSVIPEPEPHLSLAFALGFLRALQHQHPISSALSLCLDALNRVPLKVLDPERLCEEVGDALLTISDGMLSESEADLVLSLLEWLVGHSHAGLPQLSTLKNISADTYAQLCDRLLEALPHARHEALELVRISMSAVPEDVAAQPSAVLPSDISLSVHRIDELLRARIAPPSTPKRTTPPHTQNVLGMVTVSPPTALLRSPAVTGLTKTYNANDFRSLRQMPSARQNTSRLPSTHVDVPVTSPILLPGALPALPGLPPNPFGAVGDFVGLQPPFSE